MPILYILAAAAITTNIPTIISPIESRSCQAGTPKGTLIIITMGEVSGSTDNQNASPPLGSLDNAVDATKIEKLRGIVMGKMNCWVSVSLSIAAATAANREL